MNLFPYKHFVPACSDIARAKVAVAGGLEPTEAGWAAWAQAGLFLTLAAGLRTVRGRVAAWIERTLIADDLAANDARFVPPGPRHRGALVSFAPSRR